MSVKIEIFGEDARQALHELHAFASGALPQKSGTVQPVHITPVSVVEAVEPPAATQEAREADVQPAVQEEPKRERGKPSAGRARRTKEEIAEDEAADLADQATNAEPANISTGEERVDPNQPVDSPEDQAQDAADEAAEVAASRDAEKPLTNDDLKAEMTAYVQRFGMPAVQEDGAKIFAAGLGEPPAGEAAWKLSIVGDNQEWLAKAVAAWKAALAENPFKRDAVSK